MLARVLVAVACAALCAETALATSIRFTPVPERVARADAVVVGTVTEVEKEFTELDVPAGAKKVRFRIAKVKVSDELLGSGKLKEIRVAFTGAEDQPTDGLRIPTPVLEKDNEVVLFLRKRPDDVFVFADRYFGAVGKGKAFLFQTEKLEDTIKEAKAACKVMADTGKALKSKEESERMMAAWMLLTRYRAHPAYTMPGGKAVEEKLSAEESQAILEGLLTLAEKNSEAFYVAAYSLNLTAEEGFGPAFTREKAVDWIKERVKTYRVKRWVPEPKK